MVSKYFLIGTEPIEFSSMGLLNAVNELKRPERAYSCKIPNIALSCSLLSPINSSTSG